LPEEDVEGEDLEEVMRYPESVILEYNENDGTQIVYGAETTVSDAYDFYETFFEGDEWSLEYEDIDIEDGGFIMTYEKEGDLYTVIADEDNPYQDAITIVIGKNLEP